MCLIILISALLSGLTYFIRKQIASKNSHAFKGYLKSCFYNHSVDGIVHKNEYYWIDYTGDIPKDALPGGNNSNGKTTYIGKILYDNLFIPAKIDPEEKKVYYEWNFEECIAIKNIKILCTQTPENFKWINVGHWDIQNIVDKHLVIGGYEPKYKIYIGRKQLENELSIGKVVTRKSETVLQTTKDGKGYPHAEFEVLAYDSSLENNHNIENQYSHEPNLVKSQSLDESTAVICKSIGTTHYQ